MNEIVINSFNGNLTVSSVQVAKDFEKRHDKLVSEIERMYGDLIGYAQNGGDPLNENLTAENSAFKNMFIESIYQQPQNKQWYKYYELTRDGFSLLVMGFTGKKALEWKLKYIEAFNLMEQRLRQQPERKMSANELIFEMAKNNLETEKRLNSLEIRQQNIEEQTEKILDIFTALSDTAWHENIIN